MIAVVVPTIREREILTFLRAWEHQFRGAKVIVVEDNPERSFELPSYVQHVSWKEIYADLGDDAWIISRRSAAVRAYGFLLAAHDGAPIIVTTDDDCFPQGFGFLPNRRFLEVHGWVLSTEGSFAPCFDTMSPLCRGIQARGFPSAGIVPTMINHGLWNGVPDLDGKTQTAVGTITVNFSEHSIQVPPGVLFPMSSMNLAFRREALPLMWPPLMGEGQPYHRFDDIWCGWIAKKVCDHLGWAVRSGVPFVYHSRASDAERNRQLEEPGIVQNDRLWKVVHGAMIQGATPAACIADLWDQIVAEMDGDYWQKCRTAALRWVELCDRI